MDPKTLANLVLFENILQSLVTPIWGYLSDRYSRRQLLLFSCIAWGITTALVALASNFSVFFGFRLCSALALASMMPISQSVLTDPIPAAKRGKAFGRLGFWSGMGGMIGGSVSTALAARYFSLTYLGEDLAPREGIRGWRVVFFAVGIASLLLAAVVNIVMFEPQRSAVPRGTAVMTLTKRVVTKRTWLLLVAQVRAQLACPHWHVTGILVSCCTGNDRECAVGRHG